MWILHNSYPQIPKMATTGNPLVHPFAPSCSNFSCSNHSRSIRYTSVAICCLRKNGNVNGQLGDASRMEAEDLEGREFSKRSAGEAESKHGSIWQLFREAQQNILHLNEQRLAAIEELKKTKKEKQNLLDRIVDLESAKQAHFGKDDMSSRWELLLRIDSMVLSGALGTGDAFQLRKLVMDKSFGIADAVMSVQKTDSEVLAYLRKLLEQSKRNGLHIIQICTEMEPLISTGSLATYVTGLSCALQNKGNFVEIILPKYDTLNLSAVEELRETQCEFYSFFDGQLHVNKIWTGVIYGLGVTFIQPIHYSSFFNRERVHGYSDDFERFMYFSRASLDYIVESGKRPDILHIHNWETAFVGPLFWDIFFNKGLEAARILLTCQQFDSQCLGQPEKLGLCGLDPSRLNRLDRLQDNNKSHLINILKGGIVYSNKVVIMSSMHSKDRFIQSAHGLEPSLFLHKNKLLISPFGFDYSSWDPSRDTLLPENYSPQNMKGKDACKAALQQQAGLSEHSSAVLVGCIFSEVLEADLENLMGILQVASMRGIQLIFMGASSTPCVNMALSAFLEGMKVHKYSSFHMNRLADGNVRHIKNYDETLSHLIFGGSDIILCRSYDDPLLHIPLKALKYGAAPLAINSIDKQSRHAMDRGSGSTQFSQYINSTFANMTLTQVLDEMKHRLVQWNQKILDAMSKDFSWDAECYDVHVTAYESIKNL